MGFRLKSFIFSLLIVIGTLGVVYAILQIVILQQFLRLESDAVWQDAQRTQAAISAEQSSLDQLTASWALRPETVRVVGESNRVLAGQEIYEVESAALAVDAVVYFDRQGQLIFGRERETENGQQSALPAELRDLIRQYELLPTGSKAPVARSGFIQTSQGPWMLSLCPVKLGSSANPTFGFLTFGRHLDRAFFDQLSITTQLALTLQSDNSPDIPTDFQQALSQLSRTPEQIFVTSPKTMQLYRSTGEVAAFLAIQDLNGKVRSVLRVVGDRHLYQQGLKSVRELGLVLLIIGLICAVAAYIYLDRSFITRLLVIDGGINRFREAHDFTQPIEVEGKDELAQLAAGINATIVELVEHQDGQIRAERQFREALQNLSLAAVIIDRDGRMVFCNDHLINISGWSSKELTGHFWCSRFIPQDEQAACRTELQAAFRTGRITAHEDAQIVLRSGSTRMFSWSNTLLSGSDEAVTGIVRIGEDVTELRKAEALLRNSLRETRLHLSRLTALRSIDSTITSTMDTSSKIDSVLATIQDSLAVDGVDLLRIDYEENSLVPIAVRGLSKTFLEYQPYFDNDPVIREIHQNNEPLILISPSRSRLPLWTRSRLDGNNWIEFYGVAPMISGSRLIGVLEVFASQPVDTEDGWLEHFNSLALQAAITLENDEMIHGIQRANHELAQAYEGTLIGWARALELRDKETRGHSERMMELTMRLGRRLGMDSKELEIIGRGVLLHDIGKMGVPDYILHKPGPLTDEEWVTMRQHPQFAYNLLKNIPYLSGALDVAFCHHERWDGTGYPRKLRGEEIPFSARIFAIIDVWDALTHDRPYRPAWSEEEALNYILDQAGTQFDPLVVDAFVRMQKDSLLRQTAPLPVHFTLD